MNAAPEVPLRKLKLNSMNKPMTTKTQSKHTCDFKLGRSKTTAVCACGKFKHINPSEFIVGVPTQSKHTAGPWHIGIRQPVSDKFVFGPNGEEVANCDRLTNFPDENLANARLIASAPELLEALKRLKEYFSYGDLNTTGKQLIENAEQAIRKAEGTI